MKTKQLVLAGLLIIVSMVMIMPVMAVGDSTAAAGNPTPYVALTVSTASFTMTLTPGSTMNDVTAHLHVSANCPFEIDAKDAMTDAKPSAGYMVNWTGSAYKTDKLGAAMGISGTADAPITTSAIAPLTAADQPLYNSPGGVYTDKQLALSLNQVVALTDPRLPADHNYRIPITFTITGS